MSNRPEIVIDSDGHICEPELVWTQYTQAKYRDRVLQVRTVEGRSQLCIEGHMRRAGGGAISRNAQRSGDRPGTKRFSAMRARATATAGARQGRSLAARRRNLSHQWSE